MNVGSRILLPRSALRRSRRPAESCPAIPRPGRSIGICTPPDDRPTGPAVGTRRNPALERRRRTTARTRAIPETGSTSRPKGSSPFIASSKTGSGRSSGSIAVAAICAVTLTAMAATVSAKAITDVEVCAFNRQEQRPTHSRRSTPGPAERAVDRHYRSSNNASQARTSPPTANFPHRNGLPIFSFNRRGYSRATKGGGGKATAALCITRVSRSPKIWAERDRNP